MASQKSRGREFYKYSGLGFEFVVIIGIFSFLGNRADERWQIEPWGILAGCGVGLVTGIYFLLKDANKMFDSLDSMPGSEAAEHDAEQNGPDADRSTDGDEP